MIRVRRNGGPRQESTAPLDVLQGLPRVNGNPFVIVGAGPRKPKERTERFAPRADLKNPWAAVSRAAKLEGVRIHDLRHSFAATGAGASLGLPMIGKPWAIRSLEQPRGMHISTPTR